MIHQGFENANFGNIENVQGGVHLGVKNVFVGDDTNALIRKIEHRLKYPDLPEGVRFKFQDWLNTLFEPDGAIQFKKICYEFQKEEEQLEKISKEKNERLKIWLNRKSQCEEFRDRLIKFSKPKEVCAFIFCILGHAEKDVVEDASEMLQLFYFNNIMRNNSPEINKQKRINESVYLKTKTDAQSALETILRDLLNLDIFCDYVEIIQKLETDFKNQRLVARCKVREWQEEGIKTFFDLWSTDIKRENRYPLILFLEFHDPDSNSLTLLLENDFCNEPTTLLSPLNKVEMKDVIDFYARELTVDNRGMRYDAIFDHNSLKIEDTPLYYREAINKLQLKYK